MKFKLVPTDDKFFDLFCEVAENAAQATRVAQESGDALARGIKRLNDIESIVQETADKIAALGQSGKRIGNIVEVIRQISEQTSLLALNAYQFANVGEIMRSYAGCTPANLAAFQAMMTIFSDAVVGGDGKSGWLYSSRAPLSSYSNWQLASIAAAMAIGVLKDDVAMFNGALEYFRTGEGNGGVIDPRVGFVRDPFIGMGLILNLLADTGQPLSRLVASLPVYYIVKDKYTVPREQLPAVEKAVLSRWPEATPNRIDGLRLDWPDRWLHVRSSNTEPIIRVIAEAPRREDAENLCRQVGTLIRT